MALEVNKLYQGDCRNLLQRLDDNSIDCCITSPPYWSLRDYNVEGQIGLEPTFEEYINVLCDIYDLVKQKLKKSGTCWVNLGDTYGSSKTETGLKSHDGWVSGKAIKGYQKCLVMIPQRFAIEMINRGWILRNVIIWHKPNCMPSSAKDRFTVDFEYVYFFTKNKKYYFEQQREPLQSDFIYSRNSKKGGVQEKNNPRANWKEGLTRKEYNSKYKEYYGQTLQGFVRNDSIKKERDQSRIDANILFPNNSKKQQEYINFIHDHGKTHRLGRNKRCVWTIPTQPNPEAHFATFNPDLITPMIKAGCPGFVCKKCGKPREKIIETIRPDDYDSSEVDLKHQNGCGGEKFSKNRPLSKIFDIALRSRQEFKGYTDCGCNAGFRSGIVLDPFAGIGTTLYTAWNLGRNYIGFEISAEYCKIAEKMLKQKRSVFERNKNRITTEKTDFNQWL